MAAVYAAQLSTCLIFSNGTVHCWGFAAGYMYRLVHLNTVVQVAMTAADQIFCYRLNNGTVYCEK